MSLASAAYDVNSDGALVNSDGNSGLFYSSMY